MQDRDTRTAILQLRAKGHGIRRIARDLRVSRGLVKRVLKAGTAEVPVLEREEKAEPYEAKIVELYGRCSGNLVRVHEELAASGVMIAYPTLTGFCRRHGIGARLEREAPGARTAGERLSSGSARAQARSLRGRSCPDPHPCPGSTPGVGRSDHHA